MPPKRTAAQKAATQAKRTATAAAIRNKRKAAEDAAGGEQRGAGRPRMKTQAVLDEEMKVRAFWEAFATDLLLTWVLDYSNVKHPVPSAIERESPTLRADLLFLLVEKRDYYLQPEDADDDVLGELQRCWKKIAKPGREVPVPGFDGEPPQRDPDEELSAADEEEEEEEKAETPQRKASNRGSAQEQLKPTEKKKSPEKRRQERFDTDMDEAAGHDPDMCRTCLTHRPSSSSAPVQWRCALCGLRGDLPATDPANVALIRVQAPGGGPPQFSPASSAGKSSSDTIAHGAVGRQQQEFRAQAAAGPAMPAFAIAPCPNAIVEAVAAAERARLVRTAFEKGRESYRGDRFLAPLPELVELIQAGKLKQVGFALPKLVPELGEAEVDTANSFSLSASGTLTAKGSGLTAPALDTVEAFMQALHATVYPALVAQPVALTQWFSLSRSVLAITERYGWAAARSYLSTVLYDRTLHGRDFAPVHQTAIMEFGLMARLPNGKLQHPMPPVYPPGNNHSGGQQQQRQQGGGGSIGGGSRSERSGSKPPCRQWNGGNCTFAVCKFAHVCSHCRSSAHKEGACPSRPSEGGAATKSSTGSVASSSPA
jgi:hypothetical protein